MKIKIPSYYSWHWDSGKVSCMVSDGEKEPDLTTGWVVVFHPAQEVEVNEKGIAAESMQGTATVAKATFDKYLLRGSKLSWRQRLKGIA